MSIDFAALESDEQEIGGVPGVMVDGAFWYWDGVITRDAIAFRARARAIGKALMIGGLAGAVIAFVLFGVAVIAVPSSTVLTLRFWTAPQSSLVFLWIGILFLCFVWYKYQSRKELMGVLPTDYRDDPSVQTIASLAAASKHRGMYCACSPETIMVFEEAFRLANAAHHADVGALHLFIAATQDRDVRVLFARLGISLATIVDPLRRKMATFPNGETQFGLHATMVLVAACAGALRSRRPNITALDVVAACFDGDAFLQEVVFAAGADADAFHNAITWLRIHDALRRRYVDFRRSAAFKPTGNMDRAYTAVATPFLDGVSDDVTRAAAHGRLSFCVERDAEVTSILRAMESGRQSVVLVGVPGVGKGAVIESIAERMVSERVPDVLKDKRLLRIDVAHIVTANGGHGADERFLFALHEAAMSGNIILVIENVHQLVGVGGSMDLSAMLASELEKRYVLVIATTTPSDYAEKVERSSLGSKLQRIAIDEPDRNTAIHILESHIGGIEAKHRVAFTYHAVAACVDFASRYLHESVLPTSAIAVAQDAALEVSKKPKDGAIAWVIKEDIAARVSDQSHVPVTSISQDEGQKLLQLESRLHERVIGQSPAIAAVASALRRARTELRSGSRPMANFLFLGPTGVGKTELAKTTSEVYFGSENAMVRFDMSEYQDQASIARLIGGNGAAGLLTEAVRRTPFTLVLLDELEKSHPDILNVFLQVMDDGRLTDGMGRTIDFTNVILIATSNAGTQFIQDGIAKGTDLVQIKTELLETELRAVYRPEFLNRFDDVIVFTPLTADDVAAIAYLMIAKIDARLQAKGIALRVDDEAVHELAALGYDPKFGARPLRRVLQERLENVIAERILQGDVGRRDTVVYQKGGIVTVEKAAAL